MEPMRIRPAVVAVVAALSLAGATLAQAPKPAPKPAAKPAAPAAKPAAPAKPAAAKPAASSEPEPVSAAPAGESLEGPHNVWLKNVTPRNRSSLTLWPAWCAMPAMPAGDRVPMPADLWSGMPDREAWEKWAAAGAALRTALRASSNALVLGVAYGPQGGDAAWREKGIVALPGSAVGEAAFPYLRALRGIAAFATVEMQRLGTAGKFDEAFTVGLDGLRVLRQAAEQRMLVEKAVALELLASSLEAHRCFMADHLDRIPLEVWQRVALKGYPFIKSGDRERLARLELPEGDRAIIEEQLVEVFKPDGQPDGAKFVERFAAVQAQGAPLVRFGAVARWEEIASMHGSLDATRERLGQVYDDWWRRWRMRFYDPMVERRSEYSRLNPGRYAVAVLLTGDLQRVFNVRLRLIAELNGTALAAGLGGFRKENGSQWPRDLGQIFPLYAVKKLDFDPYSRKYGTFQYRDLGDQGQPIETKWGQVQATGACIWSLGVDHADGGAAKHEADAAPALNSVIGPAEGDLVMFPPPRQLAQKAGLIK
jgi:hypothetical protein